MNLSKEHQTRRAKRTDAPSKTKDCASSNDSAGERNMGAKLIQMQTEGLISNIRHHPASIQLTKKVKWNIDWIYRETKRGCDIAADFKGIRDGRFETLLQLWPEFGPMPLQIWEKKWGRFVMVKEIKGKSK